jgi:GT2 family glycosyltransferase
MPIVSAEYSSQWWVTMQKSIKQASIIIPHHTGNFVPAAIKSIQQSKEVEYEIIVVTSVETASFEGARTVLCKGGPSHKRNVGARYATHDYLFFLDDDVEVTPYFLREMIRGMDEPNVGMVYGKSLNMERRKMLDNAGSFLTWTGFLWAREESGLMEDKGQFDKYEDIFAGKGACMALKRSSFYKVQGFDPDYEILAEETDISWKVWFIGQRVLWVPRAVLFHKFNTSLKPWNYFYSLKRVYFNGCFNYLAMLSKFLEWKNWWRIVPFHYCVWFCAGIGMLFGGKAGAGFNILKALWNFPLRWKQTMQRRALVQPMRTKSDAELFKIILRQPRLSFYWNRFWHYLKTGRHG